ncbi:phosphatidylserine decarboxylase family protein [Calditrichota bacterium]
MINKSGYKIIMTNGIIFVCLLTLLHFYDSEVLEIITFLTCILFIFNFFFFRDPEREIPQYESLIVSPADGKVIKIKEVAENHYLHNKAIMVSIFMSIFNVHVNRIPISGEIEYLNYKSGKFIPAFKDKSSDLNERMMVGIKSPQGKILLKQIAGIIARRIVCNLKKADKVEVGAGFGMIMYGSRVDIIVPLSSKINVQLNQKVIAGETIIGELLYN